MNFNSNYSRLIKMKNSGVEFRESKVKSTPIAMVAPELKHYDTDTGISKTCAVMGCEDSKNHSNEEYFRFPKDLKQRRIWTELTGRSNWTPTDYSYICIQHFSVDSFECNSENNVVLTRNAVPSLKLPGHVLEGEYIDEETLDNEWDSEMAESDYLDEVDTANASRFNGAHKDNAPKQKALDNVELLKLFNEVKKMQFQTVTLKEKLKRNMKIYNRHSKHLNCMKEIVETKKDVLNQKRKKKQRILLSLQDKIREDKNGLVLAMPVKYNGDLKDFALNIYKFSPPAYIYVRNSLRTLLPSTDVLEQWLNAGYTPRNILKTNNTVKVGVDQTETELTCKVSLH